MIGAKLEPGVCCASTWSKTQKGRGGERRAQRKVLSSEPRSTQSATRKPIKILLIEHRTNDAHLLRVLLSAETHYDLTIAPQLARGISRLVKDKLDSFSLTSRCRTARVLKPFATSGTQAYSPDCRASCSRHDEELATRALQEGAQDYLVKEQLDRALLFRARPLRM